MSDSNTNAPLPLFYSKPVALTSDSHANAGLRKFGGYAFAANTNAIPLVADEFFQAQACYPIVFSGAELPAALAIVGLATRENLFIEADGRWRPFNYIPAYVRRYPFIPAQSDKNGDLTLFIDEPAIEANAPEGERFFVNGTEASDATAQSLGFCQAYHAQSVETEAFGKALKDLDLLVTRAADIELNTPAGVKRQRLDGFQVVDPAKLGALDDATFLNLRQRGWLPLIYAHLMSLNRWASLIDMAAPRA